jgi:hypothetical protein
LTIFFVSLVAAALLAVTAPPQPDPVEVERQKKKRLAERKREARKKGVKLEDLPEDPPEPLPPPTYTGQVGAASSSLGTYINTRPDWLVAMVFGTGSAQNVFQQPSLFSTASPILKTLLRGIMIVLQVPWLISYPLVLSMAACTIGAVGRVVLDHGRQATTRHCPRHTRKVCSSLASDI